jgi:hypothetical protein
MKYIKTYENTKKIYRKNDIVLLKGNLESFLLPYAKIITRYKHRPDEVPIDKYYVEILFPNTEHWAYYEEQDVHSAIIEDYMISRKLTKEELQELDIKKIANKYNL